MFFLGKTDFIQNPNLFKGVNDIMNKKFMTVTAFAAALLMLTSCGNFDSGSTSETEASTTAIEQTEETTSQASTETEAETEAETTEAETEAEAVSETEETADDTAQLTTFSGDFYTVSVDTSKWVDFSEYKQLAAEAAESLDNGIDLTAEDYNELCDVMYMYSDVSKSANVNVVSTDLGVEMDMDAEAVGPLMADSFDAVEGYKCDSWESVTVNGENALKLVISGDVGGSKTNMVQYQLIKGGKQVVITLTVVDAETDDTLLADFDALVNTVVLN